jgi:hypothetical protein
VQEAVEMAFRFRDEKLYDWFRGQTHVEPPYPQQFRLRIQNKRADLDSARLRIAMFCKWLSETPDLAYLLQPQHIDKFFAILQHYGVPTDLLDFTTDPGVAGFFAADTRQPIAPGTTACIYCLNTADLLEMWKTYKELDERPNQAIETVVVDVDNLWRLQAQSGCFLRTTYNWDVDYAMDLIEFPYSGYPSAPVRDAIYPTDKSPLEQRLDQYFDREKMTSFAAEMFTFVRKLKARGKTAEVAFVAARPDGFCPEAFRDPSLVLPLQSWPDHETGGWSVTPVENFDALVRTQQVLLDPNLTPESIEKAIGYAVRQALRTTPTLRDQQLSWLILNGPESFDAASLGPMLRRAWNGLRRLPYTDEEVASGLGRVAFLVASRFHESGDNETRAHFLDKSFGPGQWVAFAAVDNSGSQAWVTSVALLGAQRDDMKTLLAPEHEGRELDAKMLFQVVYNPRRMFEFPAFRRLFAEQVVPIQVVDRRALVLFNPTDLQTFGTP